MLSATVMKFTEVKSGSRKTQKHMTRKTKWTELLDCVSVRNTDGIGVQDLPDECHGA